MKEHPIIFQGPGIRAIQNNKKTQTRRVVVWGSSCVNGSISHKWRNVWHFFDWEKARKDDGPSPAGNPGPYLHVPYPPDGTVHRIYPRYQIGDLLWVRETWFCEGRDLPGGGLHYRANASEADEAWFKEEGWKWKPPIYMPRRASRITLRIEDVRVERVQDIDIRDALAEGIKGPFTALSQFADLWDSINVKRGYSWDVNPWVWVIVFSMVMG